MKKGIFVILLILQSLTFAQDQSSNPTLIMEDGQIKSHPVQIFIRDVNITKEMAPVLCMVAISDETREKLSQTSCMGLEFKPFEVAPNQTNTLDIAGIPITIKGTMMLFDIYQLKIPTFSIGLRVIPIIRWIDKKEALESGKLNNHYANIIGEGEVYIGNPLPAVVYTLLIIALFFVALVIVSRKRAIRISDLIKIYDLENGRLSLSLTQMLLWTIFIGSMVMIFSFMYLKVPEIPDSLVALMGLSITTASVGHYQANRSLSNENKNKVDETKNKKKKNEKVKEAKRGFWNGLYDLLSAEKQGTTYLSIAKTQHLFWTVLIIILFVFKSGAEGQLWNVPNELVTLMGISQGSYLIRNELEFRQQGPKG